MPFNLADFLPQPPWLGPPLPRFLGIAWPWLQEGWQPSGLSLPALPSPKRYFLDVEEGQKETRAVPYQAPLATYENKEEWEIEWSDEGLPTKIVVHRNAVQK